MAIPKSIIESKGSWAGKSKLNLPWLEPDKRITESESKLHIDGDHHNSYASITYTWAHEGKAHEGAMLLSASKDSKKVQIAWADSWHQSEGLLIANGTTEEDGSIKTKGTYKAGGEEWGWTIALLIEGEKFRIKMENVMPSGEAEWAVDGLYSRE